MTEKTDWRQILSMSAEQLDLFRDFGAAVVGPSVAPGASPAVARIARSTFDCSSLEEAVEFTRDLARANPGGAYEIRPVRLYLPGSEMK